MAELIDGIVAVRKALAAGERPRPSATMPWGWISGGVAGVIAIGYVGAYLLGMPVWVPFGKVSDPAGLTPGTSGPKVAAQKGSDPEGLTLAKAAADKAQAERDAKLIADAEARIRTEIETTRKADEAAAARKKVEDEVRAKAAAEAEAKRVAAIKADDERKAAAEATRLADLAAAEERRKAQEMSPGRVFRDCTDGCPEMVVVPAGSFTMGSTEYDGEKPPRTVTIRQVFAVAKFEVTFAEWEACVAGGGCQANRNPGDQGWGKGRRPVINVSWNDAKEYVAWLSRKTGQTYRLLTEAEWEYAARARSNGKWTFGDDERRLAEFAWYSANSGSKTQPVGGKAVNAFGLHDMHGNVWEWVEDCWHSNYSGALSDGSAWTTACADGNNRVVRGGSWSFSPVILRSAIRLGFLLDYRSYLLGFRVGRVVSR